MDRVNFSLLSASAAYALVAIVGIAPASDSHAPQSVEFFENKIRPVLVEHCAKCHGADARRIKGGLRLDSRAALLRGGDSGPAVLPGDPAKSRLIEAITYKNVELQMPPKGKLPSGVIADLVAWVQGGAVWPEARPQATRTLQAFDLAGRRADHWAWHPVRRPDVPAVKDRLWPRGPVDAFVLKKLEDNGLAPALPADGRTLLRRVTFAITGLPPTPEEIDAFLGDQSPRSLETVVDRLLSSPGYGERWARHWLDLVRYADSKGHEFDYSTPNAWQYRDYVIRALNDDVPYNQFVLEHVAGDCLKTPRRNRADGFNESVLGTGFWLLGEEVHSPVDIRQDLADRIDNRIDVLTKTFLGLTVSCARCHDHKFDAISTNDYYALFGILEGGSSRLVRFDSMEHEREVARQLARSRESARVAVGKALAIDAAPVMSNTASYLLAARDALQAKTSTEHGKASALLPANAADFSAAFRDRLREIAAARTLGDAALGEWVAAILAAGPDPANPLHAWAKVVTDSTGDDPERFAALLRTESERLARAHGVESKSEEAIVIDYARSGAGDWLADEGAFGTGPDLPGSVRFGGSGQALQFAEEGAAVYDRSCDSLRAAPGAEEEFGALGHKMRAGRTIRTPPFTLATGKLYYRVKGAGIAYAAVEGHSLIAGPLHGQLVLSFPASEQFRWIVHDLTPYKGLRARVEFTPAADADLAIAKVLQSEKQPAYPSQSTPMLLGLLSSAKSAEALAAGYERLFRDALAPTDSDREIAAGAAGEQARLKNWILRHPGLLTGHEVDHAVAKARAESNRLATGVQNESRLALALMDARGVDEHVFVRGSHKALGDRVPRRFLEALAGPAPLDTGTGSGRLELARQMVDPDLNPLLSRVIVNRIWHHLFGRGIVASTDNFGVLGDRPTHPELLDYLADNLVRNGWSLKSMIRILVLSSAYRMDSRGDDAAEATDPQNGLLHRMRLQRLEGEAIRDGILAVSGRLDPRAFGRPVPVHLTPFLEGRGRPESGPVDGKGRRSIYLAVRRNFLSPLLMAFDTPIPFSTVGRRAVSNVPAQALILLNDPFVHEQANIWARRVLERWPTTPERIQGMYLQAFGRPPTDRESECCSTFIRRQVELRGLDPKDAGPWVDLAHTLFNVKEFIFVR
jgi:hypothetical protein